MKTQNTQRAILTKRNKLVTLNLKLKDTRQKNAVSFAIKLIDQLLDGDYILNKELAKTYKTNNQ